jgi:hypothetical protein
LLRSAERSAEEGEGGVVRADSDSLRDPERPRPSGWVDRPLNHTASQLDLIRLIRSSEGIR